MNLFTDDDKRFTIQNTGYKNVEIARESIQIIEKTMNKIEKQVKIPGPSPVFLNPQIMIKTKTELRKFIDKQKMYRILALLNRAKVVYKKSKNILIKDSIEVFETWMNKYKNRN